MGTSERTAACMTRLFVLGIVLVATLARAEEGPTDQAACEQRGGRWGAAGLNPTPVCNLPTKDAGKVCRDGSECESGACIADLTPAQKTHLPQQLPGKCSAWRKNPGCLSHVERGWVHAITCTD